MFLPPVYCLNNIRAIDCGDINTSNGCSCCFAGTTSSFRGVSLKSTGRWKAAIKIEGRGYSLGTYDSETVRSK